MANNKSTNAAKVMTAEQKSELKALIMKLRNAEHLDGASEEYGADGEYSDEYAPVAAATHTAWCTVLDYINAL